jgi:hypothetical protein
MAANSIAKSILSDPRNRSEAEWLDTLDYLVDVLAASTACHLHLGAYWCSDEPVCRSASIGSRVRSRSPLPGVRSDYWEAALCYTGNAERAFADAYVFPYREGRLVSSAGRLPEGEEVEEFRRWQFVDGRFVDKGWQYPDGPGEWSWVKEPGDEYPEEIHVTPEGAVFQAGESAVVHLSGLQIPRSLASLKMQNPRISLVHVNRDQEGSNLSPWTARPPRPMSHDTVSLHDARIENEEIQVDLTKFRVRGGWIPGRYYASIRVQNLHDPEETKCSARISSPFQFTIVD